MWRVLVGLLSLAALAADFSVTISPARHPQPLDGRLLVMLSTDPKAEPRFQLNDGPTTQLVFGLDVENWKPGTAQTVDGKAQGWPIALGQVKPGEYFVQALLHKYETFRRADGHKVKLTMNCV